MATYLRTHVTDDTYVPLLRKGAAAPFANEKAMAVITYVQAATEASIPIDRVARGMVARQTGLLLSEGWELPAILRAIDRFARRRRMAGHLAQWVRENAGDEREKAHLERKGTPAQARSTMRRLGEALREAGL